MNTKKITFYGMFLGVALIFSYVEQLIPINVGVPGVKLGLANIITMLLLYFIGVRAAVIISVLRILLSGMLFGNGFAIVYSLAGAASSILAMSLLKKSGKFGFVGISVMGGVFHNIGQIIVAAIVLETGALIYYLPVLIISGLTAGIVIGVLSGFMMRRLAPVIRQYMG